MRRLAGLGALALLVLLPAAAQAAKTAASVRLPAGDASVAGRAGTYNSLENPTRPVLESVLDGITVP